MSTTANFEVRLYEGTNAFDVVLGTLTGGGTSATIGVQDGASRFTQVECNTGAPNNTRYAFTLGTCGPTFTPTITPTSCAGCTNTPTPSPTRTRTNTATVTPTPTTGGTTPTNTPTGTITASGWVDVAPFPTVSVSPTPGTYPLKLKRAGAAA